MDPLSLFHLALGLPAPWEVVDVAFNPKSGRIDCHLIIVGRDTSRSTTRSSATGVT